MTEGTLVGPAAADHGDSQSVPSQDDFCRELAAFIVQRSWETMEGGYTEASIMDAIQMARKYRGIQLFRKYEYAKKESQ